MYTMIIVISTSSSPIVITWFVAHINAEPHCKKYYTNYIMFDADYYDEALNI